MEPWRLAIKRHKYLMKERVDPSFWSDNIIDASEHLSNDDDWKKFYLYLTNSPIFFNEENPTVVQTLGELDTVPIIPAYEENQEVKIIKNGPCERYVMVNTRGVDMDDEKLSL